MKILCIYFERCGPHEDLCLNLDSDWAFDFKDGEIHFSFKRRLPKNFWQIGRKTSSVDSVSAIVGRNGGGKTSIASTLSQTMKIWGSEFKGGTISGGAGNCFVVVCNDKTISLFRNFSVCFRSACKEELPKSHGYKFREKDFKKPTEDSDFESPQKAFEVLYYSPYFSGERQRTASGEFSTYSLDASVTARLSKCIEDSKSDSVRVLTPLRRYQDADRNLAVRFIRDCRAKCVKTFESMGINPPGFVHYTFNNSADAGLGAALNRAASIDERYNALVELFCSVNVGVQLLLAFTGFSIAWYSFLPEDRVIPIDGILRVIDGRLLDIFRKLYCEEDVCLKVPTTNAELVGRGNRRIKVAIGELKTLAKEIPKLLQKSSSPDVEIVRSVFDVDHYIEGLDCIWEFLQDGESDYCLFSKGSKCINLAKIDKDRLERVLSLIDRISGLYPEMDNGLLELEFDPSMSSGEMAYIMSFARIDETIRGLPKGDVKPIFVILDEVETTLHPAWQRKLVANYLRYFSELSQSHRAHLMFLTHSPNLLSDIPDGNIMLLERNVSTGKSEATRASERDFRTFGANAYDLYRHSFFLDEGPLGEFALEKINLLLREMADIVESKCHDRQAATRNREELTLLQELVGDPIVKRYIEGLRNLGLV